MFPIEHTGGGGRDGFAETVSQQIIGLDSFGDEHIEHGELDYGNGGMGIAERIERARCLRAGTVDLVQCSGNTEIAEHRIEFT
ncbi:hypothetical protein GCM10009764_75590 [Nocardia ninae]